jgi:hypothetical protein
MRGWFSEPEETGNYNQFSGELNLYFLDCERERMNLNSIVLSNIIFYKNTKFYFDLFFRYNSIEDYVKVAIFTTLLSSILIWYDRLQALLI